MSEELSEKQIENLSHAIVNQTKIYDAVNNPEYYTSSKIEVIDYIEDKNLGFCLGNVVKYISRAGHKIEADKSIRDKEIQDLKKAKWYLERRIKELEEGLTQ